QDPPEDLVHRLAVGDVERDRRRPSAPALDLGAHVAEARLVARAEHDHGSFRREGLRDRAADPPGGAGHEPDLPGQDSHQPSALTWSASRVFSSEAGSSTPRTRAPFTIFLTRPARTLPVPASTNVSTPSLASRSTHSCQRTAPETWRTRPSRAAAAVRTGAASTLLTSGNAGSRSSRRPRSASIRTCAGFMSAQWNGADTGSGTARFAPFALHSSLARATARAWPAITTCPGELMFAGETTSPFAAAAQASSTAGRSSPRIAAIAPSPTGTASCMYCPRRRTVATASRSPSV